MKGKRMVHLEFASENVWTQLGVPDTDRISFLKSIFWGTGPSFAVANKMKPPGRRVTII